MTYDLSATINKSKGCARNDENEHAEATRINLEEGRGKETVCDDNRSFQ